MRALGGVSRRESTTTRSGWRAVGDQANVEARIVLAHRADAGQDRARALAPGVAVGARRLAGDPLAGAVGERRAPVERDRRLQAQPGPAAFHARDEADVELARLLAAAAPLDGDAGGLEPRRAAPGDERVRVAQRDDDARHAGSDERIGARRRAAVVRARLERDVDRRAANVDAARRGIAQRHRLGVRAARFLRVAAAGEPAVGADDDAADARIGIGQAHRVRGQRERFAHGRGGVVRRSRGHRFVFVAVSLKAGTARCAVRSDSARCRRRPGNCARAARRRRRRRRPQPRCSHRSRSPTAGR